MTLKIGINGYKGRMGQTLVALAQATPGCTLFGVSEQTVRDEKLPYLVTADPKALVATCDAVIDFTIPEATLTLAREVAAAGKIHIIGTTGFKEAELTELKKLSASARMVQSGNMSLGVNLLATLVERVAKALTEEYDIEIYEMHHRHKKDAPSGTALLLGEAAAKGRGVKLADKKIAARDGITGERKPGDIGFAVLRGGDVVGDHRVIFAGPGEVIELQHQGFSREIYARGALKAALWAKDQKPGFYSMQDVLGLG